MAGHCFLGWKPEPFYICLDGALATCWGQLISINALRNIGICEQQAVSFSFFFKLTQQKERDTLPPTNMGLCAFGPCPRRWSSYRGLRSKPWNRHEIQVSLMKALQMVSFWFSPKKIKNQPQKPKRKHQKNDTSPAAFWCLPTRRQTSRPRPKTPQAAWSSAPKVLQPKA